MDPAVVAPLALVCLGTVFVCGLVPALQASRVNVSEALAHHGWRTIGRRGSRRWTTTFLAAEFALTFVLMSALVDGWVQAAQDTHAVIDTSNLLTAFVALPPKYDTSEARTRFYQRLLDEVRGLPRVSSATMVSSLPLSGAARRLTGACRADRRRSAHS